MKTPIALALAALLTGCIQSVPVKPAEPEETGAERIVKSCVQFKRFVVKGGDKYATFRCELMFISSEPPKPPEVKTEEYKGPEGIEV